MRYLVKAIGALEVAIGLVALYYGPMEIYCFYFFAGDGKFAYPEFTVGSAWFALLVMQNLIYYVLAAILLPLGVGTWRRRSWGHYLSVNALTVGLILGGALTAGFAWGAPNFVAAVGMGNTIALIVVLCVFTIGAPYLLLRLYRTAAFVAVFEQASPRSYIEQVPAGVVQACMLGVLFLIVMHVSIFWRCFFPWFGRVILFREGVYYLSAAIWVLTLLMAGFWQRQVWAFWGLLAYFVLMLASASLTFARYDVMQILDLMRFSAAEQADVLKPISIWLNMSIPAALNTWIVLTVAVIAQTWRQLRPLAPGQMVGAA